MRCVCMERWRSRVCEICIALGSAKASVCAKRRVACIDYRSRRSPWSHCSRRDPRAGRDKTPPPPSGKTRAHRAPPHGRVVSVPPRVPDRPSAAPDPRSTSVALTAPNGCGGCPPIDPPHVSRDDTSVISARAGPRTRFHHGRRRTGQYAPDAPQEQRRQSVRNGDRGADGRFRGVVQAVPGTVDGVARPAVGVRHVDAVVFELRPEEELGPQRRIRHHVAVQIGPFDRVHQDVRSGTPYREGWRARRRSNASRIVVAS